MVLSKRGLKWYDKNFVGPIKGDYLGDELDDVYGMRVRHDRQRDILDETSYYLQYGTEILKDCSNSPYKNYLDFGDIGAPKDLKSMLPFQPDRYTLINGRIYLSQDLGNMVLGLYSKMTIYPEIIIRLGGGYVQQKTDWWARGEVWWLISRFFMIETIGDDPRGYYFVTVGREHYEKWLENGSLPEAPKIRR